MTNEEAIEHLKDIITNKTSIHGGNEEAINMAITALEGKDIDVPTKWIPCSDCERRCKKWEHSKTLQE